MNKEPEDFLNERFKESLPSRFNGKIWDERLIQAVKDYSNQQNAALVSELKLLRDALSSVKEEVEEASKYLNDFGIPSNGVDAHGVVGYGKRENLTLKQRITYFESLRKNDHDRLNELSAQLMIEQDKVNELEKKLSIAIASRNIDREENILLRERVKELEGDKAEAIALSFGSVDKEQYIDLLNKYDKLKEAADQMESMLEDCRNQIEHLHDIFKKTGTGNAILSRIEEALTNYQKTK